MRLGITQFQKKIYSDIMFNGMMKLVESVTDVTPANLQMYNTASKLVEAQFNELFIDPKKTLVETSNQFDKAAYHFQKLSNIAEEIAVNKTNTLLEAKVDLTDDKTELSEEEKELVQSVTEDVPESLADAIAERVAAALAADAARSEELNKAIDIMQSKGDAPETIEKVIQEASAYPSSLYNSMLSFQARNHMKLAINEGSIDMETALKINRHEIVNEAKLMYAVFESFNTALKEYSPEDVQLLSHTFFRT